MPELQDLLVGHVARILRAEIVGTPSWLIRPGRAEIGRRRGISQSIYGEPTGLELPEVMRPVERWTVDAVLRPTRAFALFEFDEKQHFNQYRVLKLRRYRIVRIAFLSGEDTDSARHPANNADASLRDQRYLAFLELECLEILPCDEAARPLPNSTRGTGSCGPTGTSGDSQPWTSERRAG